ncbi:MAG: hypothetical protein NVSMB1_16320 [Polyangiales bacterium]
MLEATLQATEAGIREPDLQSLAEAVFGPARYLSLSKGRAAELAMAAALGKDRPVVVTSGMWKTTERAFLLRSGTIENGPRSADGTSDIDLDWLRDRFKRGGVDFVLLEPSNGQLAGWPLSIENCRGALAACRDNGAKFIIDATRVLANFAALGEHPLEKTKELLALSDIFFVSCAKECMVPFGGLLGVRGREMERAAFMQAFLGGTMLEPISARSGLAAGLARLAQGNADVIIERRRQLEYLAAALRARSVPIVEPIGAHAVYVRLDAILDEKDQRAGHGFEALLYLRAGVRALTGTNDALKQRLLRLILPVGALQTADLDLVAVGVEDAVNRASETPTLVPTAEVPLFEIFRRFALG